MSPRTTRSRDVFSKSRYDDTSHQARTKKPRTSRGFFFLSLESGLDTASRHQKTLIG